MIEALTYPRLLLLNNLDVDECPENGFFNPVDKACHCCEQRDECRWLNSNDEFSVLAQKPIEAIYESLLYCIDCVDAHSTHADHNVRRCVCDSCGWVQNARRLASDYRNSMACEDWL